MSNTKREELQLHFRSGPPQTIRTSVQTGNKFRDEWKAYKDDPDGESALYELIGTDDRTLMLDLDDLILVVRRPYGQETPQNV